MAGYFIYSVDWKSFEKFITEPTDSQLKRFAEFLDDQYEGVMDDFEDEDDSLAKSWSSDGEDPEAAIRDHLKKEDWYTGLGRRTCFIWSRAIEQMCHLDKKEGGSMDFRVDSDGIYWDLIEVAAQKLGRKSDESIVARFGRCPYSVKAIEPFEPREWASWWDPYHSMHPPAEVNSLIEELNSLEDAVQESSNSQAIMDYEELMPALEAISNDNRMLYVSVDT